MKRAATVLLLGLAFVSCKDRPGRPRLGTQAASGENGNGPNDPSSPSTPGTKEEEAALVPTNLRRITKTQFLNTVRLALGSGVNLRTELPDDLTKNELIAVATLNSVFSLRDAELYSDTGWDMAGQFVETSALFSAKFDCACGSMTKACLAKGLDPIGKALFHGRFDRADVYTKLFEDTAAKLSKEVSDMTPQQVNCQSTRTVVAAMIGSPESFYYDSLANLTNSADLNTASKKKYSYSLANQLAYFLWNSTPDQNLMNLAESGSLTDKEARSKLIRSMVDDSAKFKAGMKALFQDWLAAHVLDKIAASTSLEAALAKSANIEFDFLLDKTAESDDFLNTFFTTNATKLDENLASVYEVEPEATTLPKATRAGFLTRTAFLMRQSNVDTSVTKRGLFIRSHLLCEEIPPPPPTLDFNIGKVDVDDKYAVIKARMDNANCKACHVRMDPLGIGLEGYDVVGTAIDFPKLTPYQLQAEIFDKPYKGGVELSQILSKDSRVLECFAKNAFRIGAGKKESETEAAAIKSAVQKFESGDKKSLNEFIYQLLTSVM